MINSTAAYRLSVLLVTFDHEKYIYQALQSLFGQLLDEPVEVIVADDASSDRTLEIIHQFDDIDGRFKIRYLDTIKNLGITKNYQRGFAACTGRYVAVLEGDDYWTSPNKLLRQLNFLENHWECDLCSVNYFVYQERTAHISARTQIGSGHRFIDAQDLIADNLVGNFSTCMYRKSALDALPSDLFDIKSYDWIVNICVASKTLIGFLDEPMSVYRLHSEGAWSQTKPADKLKMQLTLIPEYDALTGHMFHENFANLASKLRISIHRLEIGLPTRQALSSLRDYIPPFMLLIVRSILPPIFIRWCRKLFSGNGKA